MQNTIYKVAGYLRLSREDGDKEESDSISSQRSIISRKVEELGEEASGRFSKLKIEEIDDDDKYVIDEYDGLEYLILKSRVANWNWQ